MRNSVVEYDDDDEQTNDESIEHNGGNDYSSRGALSLYCRCSFSLSPRNRTGNWKITSSSKENAWFKGWRRRFGEGWDKELKYSTKGLKGRSRR